MTLEECREACAKIAEKRSSEIAGWVRDLAIEIASEIRALPLPEAPPDERAELIRLIHGLSFQPIDVTREGQIADAILAAGWRRNT